MPSPFIDPNAPALQGKFPKLAQDMPHGLLAPPPEVREMLERERAKHPPEVFARAQERLFCEWTLGYYFEPLMFEVLYQES